MWEKSATDFLRFDYVEMKDLTKAFLTLAAAILAFSATFSEKVLGLGAASVSARVVLLISWGFFVMSVILSGVALSLLFSAAAKAVHGETYIPMLEGRSWFAVATLSGYMLFGAGSTFVVGLVMLIISAGIAILH